MGKKQKSKKTQDVPLVKGAKVNPIAGLAEWYGEALLEYKMLLPEITEKLKGQMRHWLMELTDSGMTDMQIRERIRLYVHNWQHIDRDNWVGFGVKITGITRNGHTYSKRISLQPHFEFFFVCVKFTLLQKA